MRQDTRFVDGVGPEKAEAGKESALSWEKKIVYVSEDPEGRPWYVLLVGPNVWMRRGRFSTRAGAEAFRPKEMSPWLGEFAGETGARLGAETAMPVY